MKWWRWVAKKNYVKFRNHLSGGYLWENREWFAVNMTKLDIIVPASFNHHLHLVQKWKEKLTWTWFSTFIVPLYVFYTNWCVTISDVMDSGCWQISFAHVNCGLIAKFSHQSNQKSAGKCLEILKKNHSEPKFKKRSTSPTSFMKAKNFLCHPNHVETSFCLREKYNN